ncbi:hypothetical protein [Gulosibacter chungangensis]|uniref:Uncharacterized protein n=1 Tax=Gulosibacter chungangensis TaxID=979746 RepID=A0A7J5BDU8_9MICO|nr:hypothetical protein [Gulosibacter chungangensis]KAB1644046.1 hypothetical protein F8O05_04460 [Gulosibacter chungangensis]
MNTPQPRKSIPFLVTLGVASIALVGCSGGDSSSEPTITGEATTYDSLEELRDLYVEAGGECPEWEELDPGDWDAVAGRCSDSVVITVFNDTSQIDEVVQSSLDLIVETHLLVGENWIINTANPENYVDALGGAVITG